MPVNHEAGERGATRVEEVEMSESQRTLKVAEGILSLATEGGLGNLSVEHGEDLLVGNVAHLVILVDDLAVLVADAAIARFHESIAGIVLGANVAVDAGPSVVAVA